MKFPLIRIISTIINQAPTLSPPANLTAIPDSHELVIISWDAVSGATGYEYSYKQSSETNWGSWIPTGTSRRVGVDELLSETSYDFRVRATDGTTFSAPSATATILTPQLGVPQNVTAIASSSRIIIVSWNDVPGATGYQVSYRETGTSEWGSWSSTVFSPYHISGLTANTNYDFRVRATDGIHISGVSPTTIGLTAQAPTPPLIEGLTLRGASQTGLSYIWRRVRNVDSIQYSFKLTSSSQWGEWVDISETRTSQGFSGLIPNTSYDFRVRTVIDGYFSSISSITQSTTALPDIDINDFQVSGYETDSILLTIDRNFYHFSGSSRFEVSFKLNTAATWSEWRAVSRIDYTWMRDGDDFGPIFSALGRDSLIGYLFINLMPLVRYDFRIRGYITSEHTRGVFTRYYSNIITISSTTAVLDIPSNFTATSIRDNIIRLSWDSVVGATGYMYSFVFNRSTIPPLTSYPDDVSVGNITSIDVDVMSRGTFAFRLRATDGVNFSNYTFIRSSTFELATPTNLQAIAISSSQIRISWEHIDQFLSSSERFQYSFKQTEVSDWGDWIDTTLRSVTVMNLIHNTNYDFRVRFVQYNVVAGRNTSLRYVSANTPTVHQRTLNIPNAPSTPTSLAVVPFGLGGLRATWTNPIETFTQNQIRWRASTGNYNTPQDVTPSTGNQYDITGLSKGVLYYIQVRSSNMEASSPWTLAVTGTPVGIPDAPVSLSLSPGNALIDATWSHSNTGGVALLRDEIRWKLSTSSDWGVWTDAGLDRTHQITGLINDSAYDVQVRSVNTHGDSPESTTRSATPRLDIVAAMFTDFSGLKSSNFSIGIDFSHTGTGSDAVGNFDESDVQLTRISGATLAEAGLSDFTVTPNGDNRFLINFTPNPDVVGRINLHVQGTVVISGTEHAVNISAVQIDYDTIQAIDAQFEMTDGVKVRDFLILCRFSRAVTEFHKTDINLTDVSGDTIASAGLADYTLTRDVNNPALWRLVFSPDVGYSGVFAIDITGEVLEGSITRDVNAPEVQITYSTTGTVPREPAEALVNINWDTPLMEVTSGNAIFNATFDMALTADIATIRSNIDVAGINVSVADLIISKAADNLSLRVEVPIPDDFRGSISVGINDDLWSS